MSFDKLLGDLEELQTLNKSLPAADEKDAKGDEDDAKIKAAAESSNHEEPDEDDFGGESDDDEDNEMGKSFSFQLDSGETVEAIDGTELVKSLMNRVDSQEGSMTKALGMAIDLIKSQGEQITELRSTIAKIGNEGRGRKTVVSISEKPAAAADLNKSQTTGEGMPAEEFLAKALDAQKSGKITGLDVSVAEASLLKGMAVPAHIVTKVLS